MGEEKRAGGWENRGRDAGGREDGNEVGQGAVEGGWADKERERGKNRGRRQGAQEDDRQDRRDGEEVGRLYDLLSASVRVAIEVEQYVRLFIVHHLCHLRRHSSLRVTTRRKTRPA
eukprot:3096507-Rhodomonas_salina.5